MAASLFKWFTAFLFLFPAGNREPAGGGTGVGAGAVRTVGRGVDAGTAGTGMGVGTSGRGADAVHPLYISVTEIDHNAKDKTLEVSCKIFTNDLEATLEKTAHVKVDLSDPKNKAAGDKLIADYVVKHLQLKADGRAVSLQFVGSEKEADGTWSYFVVNNVPSVKRIDASNSLLYDNFSQQINIMHVSVGGEKKSFRLNCPDTEASFSF